MGIQIKVPQQLTQDHTHLVNQQKRIPTRYGVAEQKSEFLFNNFNQAKF